MSQILLVEDDADTAAAAQALLRRAGHEVTTAANGNLALQALTQLKPDLIVLDLMMPQMDGAEFLQIMRSYRRWGSLPVVVWTGNPGELLDKARFQGINSVVIKGKATYNDLLDAVEHAIPA